MSSSKNQSTCVVEDVHLPSMTSAAFLRVVNMVGEMSFANAAAMVRMGTDNPNPRKTLFASDARDLSYVVASLSDTVNVHAPRLSVGVQTLQSQLGAAPGLSDNVNVSVCVLDLSRITLVDVDGADAIGTIGQHLARLTKKVREASAGANNIESNSQVYVVVGNEAPKNLYSDMWLKSKRDDGMVFRSVQGAMRDWQKCIQNQFEIEWKNHSPASDDIITEDKFELYDFQQHQSSAAASSPQFEPRTSPECRPMRNREGSFSDDMRARQGSFHL
jgi:hypothetical protein